MRRRQHRHPALEAAVFAAALLLSAFVGRELWRRRAATAATAPAAASSAAAEPAVLNPEKPALPSKSPAVRTETAVIGAPSIRLSRVQRRKPRNAPVPVPR